MEALNLDSLKQKYSNESPEEKKAREKQMLVPAYVNFGISIAMLVISLQYASEDKTGDATSFLKVGGAVLFVNAALKIISYFTPCEIDDKISDILSPLLDFAYFIVIIWGSVKVFGAYSEWVYDNEAAATYCPWIPFMFAFGTLVAYWIFLPLMCCCGMMGCCCKMFCKKGSSEENA